MPLSYFFTISLENLSFTFKTKKSTLLVLIWIGNIAWNLSGSGEINHIYEKKPAQVWSLVSYFMSDALANYFSE